MSWGQYAGQTVLIEWRDKDFDAWHRYSVGEVVDTVHRIARLHPQADPLMGSPKSDKPFTVPFEEIKRITRVA